MSQKYDLSIVSPHHQNITTRGPLALFVAPHRRPYSDLAPLIAEAVAKYGLQFWHPPSELLAPEKLHYTLRDAQLVIGIWETLAGRRALYQSWNHNRPILALMNKSTAVAEWLTPLIDYSQRPEHFLTDLDQALAQYDSFTTSTMPQVAVRGSRPLGEDEEATRQRIYKRVAFDQRAPIPQRLHATRILSQSGDAEQAARALSQIFALSREPSQAQEILTLLGSLGSTALRALWLLDANTSDPARAIMIARQLLRVGDHQTALFRLEQLARHHQEAVRLEAFEAMLETALVAIPHLTRLAQEADDLQIRLKAAAWLYQHEPGSREEAISILEALGLQGASPTVGQEAVEVLASSSDETIDVVLFNIAQRARCAEAQLTAAEQLHQRGERGAARKILLRLGQGTDDLAAGAAFDMLADVSDEALSDTARLMATARLASIRRRAAEILSQRHQPEAVQEAAARVFLALDRHKQARPILARLARHAENVDTCRWSARQLVLLGEMALEDIDQAFDTTADPVAGQYLAEGLLSYAKEANVRRKAAIWLAEHAHLPRAIEVLSQLALSARTSGSDAVAATDDIGRYASLWAGAARALARMVHDSPHAAVRTRALELLLREYPSELPLSLLVDLAVTGSIGAIDRSPVMKQLNVLAKPAATRIATRLTTQDVDTERRWQLLQLMTELPENSAIQALVEVSTRAPQSRIRYVAAQQLIARQQRETGFAALATIAINDPDNRLRNMALYELAQHLPQTKNLLIAIIERTHYKETFHLARELLAAHYPSLVYSAGKWVDNMLLKWDQWVAKLPLTWFDRLMERVGTR